MNNNPSKCLLFLLFFSHSVVFKSLWPKDCSTSGFLVLHYLLELFKLMSTESVMPSNHLILCRPLLLCLSVIKKWAWEGGSEGTCVYLWLIHVDLWQRPTQYCKAIILQLKVNRLKKKKEMSKLRWWNEGEIYPLKRNNETRGTNTTEAAIHGEMVLWYTMWWWK